MYVTIRIMTHAAVPNARGAITTADAAFIIHQVRAAGVVAAAGSWLVWTTPFIARGVVTTADAAFIIHLA